ncbi:MAG: YdbL family protein [Candidatus Omnitrophica bacterium]|nr:YdbL family protein [Candidatus Omnitrophota bacterium]
MKKGWILLSVLALAGCAIVNVYVTFPEEKIEKAAEELLAPPSQIKPQSNLFRFIFTDAAYAQEVIEVKKDIKTDSPVIKAAKQKMDTWREELDTYKKEGFVGETNEFTVVVRDLPSDPERAKRVRKIVNDENQQRRIMMDELLKINNVPAGEIAKFKRIFADVMKKYSPSGTWIQAEEWYRKE